ncbi:MAG TPA: hypothetical protein VFN23_15810, partial [Ktedonobacteraceae bacterium]|nr:hypothetical protein [Ktedonobacteraceae bacterium]
MLVIDVGFTSKRAVCWDIKTCAERKWAERQADCLSVWGKLNTPVIALHDGPFRIFELTLLDECESRFLAKSV